MSFHTFYKYVGSNLINNPILLKLSKLYSKIKNKIKNKNNLTGNIFWNKQGINI